MAQTAQRGPGSMGRRFRVPTVRQSARTCSITCHGCRLAVVAQRAAEMLIALGEQRLHQSDVKTLDGGSQALRVVIQVGQALRFGQLGQCRRETAHFAGAQRALG